MNLGLFCKFNIFTGSDDKSQMKSKSMNGFITKFTEYLDILKHMSVCLSFCHWSYFMFHFVVEVFKFNLHITSSSFYRLVYGFH